MNRQPLHQYDIIEFSTLKTRCAYLHDRQMKMEYKFIKNCPPHINEKLVKRGWRRFGHYFSRPKCENCNECKSLRIDVKNFKPTRSQRRVFKQKGINFIIKKPSVTKEHLTLYEKYHRHMQKRRGWDYYSVNEDSYTDLYIKGFSSYGKEIQYYYKKRVVAVDLVDFLDDGISANYFYYDPDLAKLSLGVYSLLVQIELAKKKGLLWIYPGYFVKDCQSLNYKASYRPHQVLRNLPEFDEKPIWL